MTDHVRAEQGTPDTDGHLLELRPTAEGADDPAGLRTQADGVPRQAQPTSDGDDVEGHGRRFSLDLPADQ